MKARPGCFLLYWPWIRSGIRLRDFKLVCIPGVESLSQLYFTNSVLVLFWTEEEEEKEEDKKKKEEEKRRSKRRRGGEGK